MSEVIRSFMEQHPDDCESDQFKYLEAGENVVELLGIRKIERVIDEFTLDDGTIKKNPRYVFDYGKDKPPLKIPVSVWKRIKVLHEEFDERLREVKVIKTGSGLKTDYEVIPLL